MAVLAALGLASGGWAHTRRHEDKTLAELALDIVMTVRTAIDERFIIHNTTFAMDNIHANGRMPRTASGTVILTVAMR